MACSSCGRKSRHSAPPPKMMMNVSRAAPEMNDEQYVMVRLIDGNRGQHPIIGASTKTKYGYRAHGDTFLVHRDDIAAHPGKFEEAVKQAVAPVAEVKETPPPVLEPDAQPLRAEYAVHAPVKAPEQPFDLQTVPGVTAAIANQLERMNVHSLEDLADLSLGDLIAVKGIAEARAEQIQAYVAEQLEEIS